MFSAMAKSEETTRLSGLLVGLARLEYYGDTSITYDYLKEELYPEVSDDNFKAMIQKTQAVIKSMASSNMNMNQVEAFIKSQAKKKDSGVTEENGKVFMKFWKSHQARIHESLVSKTNWNNSLKNLSWRIDVKARSQHVDQINIPTAIVEMQIGDQNGQESKSEVLRFEMDEAKVKEVISNLNDIENKIQTHCQ